MQGTPLLTTFCACAMLYLAVKFHYHMNFFGPIPSQIQNDKASPIQMNMIDNLLHMNRYRYMGMDKFHCKHLRGRLEGDSEFNCTVFRYLDKHVGSPGYIFQVRIKEPDYLLIIPCITHRGFESEKNKLASEVSPANEMKGYRSHLLPEEPKTLIVCIH